MALGLDSRPKDPRAGQEVPEELGVKIAPTSVDNRTYTYQAGSTFTGVVSQIAALVAEAPGDRAPVVKTEALTEDRQLGRCDFYVGEASFPPATLAKVPLGPLGAEICGMSATKSFALDAATRAGIRDALAAEKCAYTLHGFCQESGGESTVFASAAAIQLVQCLRNGTARLLTNYGNKIAEIRWQVLKGLSVEPQVKATLLRRSPFLPSLFGEVDKELVEKQRSFSTARASSSLVKSVADLCKKRQSTPLPSQPTKRARSARPRAESGPRREDPAPAAQAGVLGRFQAAREALRRRGRGRGGARGNPSSRGRGNLPQRL